MLVAAFALASAVTLSQPPPAARPNPNVSPRAAAPAVRQRGANRGFRPFLWAGDVYSPRAKRRIANYLRLRLLELRLRGLERASEVIEHRLPLEALLSNP